MKKGLILVLALLLVIVCVGSSVAFAEDAMPVATAARESEEITDFIKELCLLNASGNKAAVANYLTDKFRLALGEDTDITASDSKVKQQVFRYDSISYSNIIARLEKAGATKQIIIGAHYDVFSGEGAADNVVGVAALYRTMQKLAENASKIPYNITFVAFDGEEQGLLGSDYFVNGYNNVTNDGMSNQDLDNTLLMFNIDSIALGSELYLVCENKSTDLAKLILNNTQGIKEKPYARGTYGSYLDSIFGFGYGYYEFIQGSDHTPFRLAGVPIAFFFSGTYSGGSWDINAGDAINTNSDTYENLNTNLIVERIQTVSNAIVSTVLDEDFSQVAENARSQLVNLDLCYNSWWPSIAIAVILVVLAVLTFLYYRKLQKKAILGTAEIKTRKVFDKPDASDIFSFDQTGSNSKSDIDDIFTFKK